VRVAITPYARPGIRWPGADENVGQRPGRLDVGRRVLGERSGAEIIARTRTPAAATQRRTPTLDGLRISDTPFAHRSMVSSPAAIRADP